MSPAVSTTSLLSVRLEDKEKSFISRAAKKRGSNISDYVREAVRARAQMDLMERPTITISAEKWDEFTVFMDRPAREIPKLRELLSQPAPWDQ